MVGVFWVLGRGECCLVFASSSPAFLSLPCSIHITQSHDISLCFKCLRKILEPSRNVTLFPSCHQPSECCYSAVKVETSVPVVFNTDAVLPWLANVCFCPACHVGFARLLTRTRFAQ